MKFFAILIMGCAPLVALATIDTKTEQKDRGARGLGKTTTITRDTRVIYKLFEQDQNRDGVTDNYIESFLLNDRVVFQITMVGGKRGMLSRRQSDAQIILSSKDSGWQSDEIFIEDSEGFEFYTLQPSGYYLPVDDQKKDRLAEANKATNELTDGMKEADPTKIKSAVDKLDSISRKK